MSPIRTTKTTDLSLCGGGDAPTEDGLTASWRAETRIAAGGPEVLAASFANLLPRCFPPLPTALVERILVTTGGTPLASGNPGEHLTAALLALADIQWTSSDRISFFGKQASIVSHNTAPGPASVTFPLTAPKPPSVTSGNIQPVSSTTLRTVAGSDF